MTEKKDILVPPMGESLTEATVARWLKKKGDVVELDEPLVELETDKVTLEVAAPAAGILSHILAPEGSHVEIGTLLGHVTEGKISTPPVKEELFASPPLSSPDPLLSPAVRKMVAESQINPEGLRGTGKGGRLTKEDMLMGLDSRKDSGMTQDKKELTERAPMSRLRQRIAERLKDAQNTAAILTTFNEVDMTHILALRTKFKESFEKKHGVKLGFMSFFLKACLVALKEIPAVNAEIEGNDLIYKNYCDIGVAVGLPQGLVVPVVRNVDHMGFAEIEKEIATLGQKAKTGKLTMAELQGGTFTISNGGIYGSLLSTPILNPPQSGILGMHKIQERPVAIQGKIEIRPMMYVALSYDHRIVDGREAVTFLVRVKECLEQPDRLLLDV